MKTTIKEIYKHRPCSEGFAKLLNGLFETTFNEDQNIGEIRQELTEDQFEAEVTILQILEINGVQDAFWSLRTQEYLDYCLILADVVESVLYIFEAKYESIAPRGAIEAIREYKKGNITIEQLKAACSAAGYTAASAASDVAYAAYAAAGYAYTAAGYAADAADAADADDAKGKQWKVNEEILRRYL